MLYRRGRNRPGRATDSQAADRRIGDGTGCFRLLYPEWRNSQNGRLFLGQGAKLSERSEFFCAPSCLGIAGHFAEFPAPDNAAGNSLCRPRSSGPPPGCLWLCPVCSCPAGKVRFPCSQSAFPVLSDFMVFFGEDIWYDGRRGFAGAGFHERAEERLWE